MKIIFIILFCSISSSDSPMMFHYEPYAYGRIEICETQEKVNEIISTKEPHRVYSYNLETKELKTLEWKFNRVLIEGGK